MDSFADFKSRLEERKKELNERLLQIEHDPDEPMNPDIEERAVEREGDEVLEHLGQSGLDELRSIEAALTRIHDGTYGVCASCGEQISQERLDAVPTTPLCRNCVPK